MRKCAARLAPGAYRWPAAGVPPVTMTATEPPILKIEFNLAGAQQRAPRKKITNLC